MNEDRESDLLYAINDALSQISSDWGLLERWEDDEVDERLNDAVHAAFRILVGREGGER